jgi:hypothetical protein
MFESKFMFFKSEFGWLRYFKNDLKEGILK